MYVSLVYETLCSALFSDLLAIWITNLLVSLFLVPQLITADLALRHHFIFALKTE
jgi:hypothetical protein